MTQQVTQQLVDLLAPPASVTKLTQASRLLAKWRTILLENTLVQKDGENVQSGPFKGMVYNGVTATECSRLPRLIGYYERTLRPVIDEIISCGYPLVIDVGCAEGYYAVGLAMQMPQTCVWARDTNPKAQANCAQLAALNGVADRVKIGGIIAHGDFDICSGQDTIVICDIEGAERKLLDPDKAPGLLQADILVESRECDDAGLTETLQKRFATTHDVERFDRAVDSSVLPPWMESLSDLDRLIALWEWRSGSTPWLWMRRRA
jgi:hypothetical protein